MKYKIAIKVFIILSVLINSAIYAAVVPGSSPKYPVTFSHLEEWMKDSRSTLDMFEETIRTDMLATRINYHFTTRPVYMLMDNGTVYETSVSHITFQGMFWGPLFTYGVAMVPAFIIDLTTGKKKGLVDMNKKYFKMSLEAQKKQDQEIIPISGIFRINVLFTADLLLLDMKKFGGELYGKSGISLLGRSYAGLAFKLLETMYLFTGFSFLHYPYIEGYQEFADKQTAFADKGGMPRYSWTAPENGFQPDDLLYETRTRFFVYNNIMDFFQVRALLNIGAEEVLNTFGLGFIFDFWERWNFNSYFSYLKMSDKYSLDFIGDIYLTEGMYIIYKWNFALSPSLQIGDYFKLGVDLNFKLSEGRLGARAINFKTYGITYLDENERKWGFYVSAGVHLPLSTKFNIGVGYNVDETVQKLPFSTDTLVYFINFEIGMNNDFDYQLKPVKKEL